MMIFVVVEFHPLNDVIAESDTDVGMRLDVTRRRGGAATHGEARHGVKPAGEVDFVRRSAPDPRPAESLPAAIEGQINPIGLGLCRTDAHKPAIVRSIGG